MKLIQTFMVAAKALMRNKTRSLLTILGVIIGVGSVISMVAVGEGAKESLAKTFDAMGTNMVVVSSGTTRVGGIMGGLGSMPSLTWYDLDAIRREAPAVRRAAPVMSAKKAVIGVDNNWNTQISGTTPEYFQIRNWRAAEGMLFSQSDVDMSAKVAVIGETVADHLFGAGIDPVGGTIRIGSTPYQVVGILERKGQSMGGSDMDDVVFVPISVFRSKIQGGGGSMQQFIAGVIFAGTNSEADTYRAQSQITGLLRDRHHIENANDDDFQIRNLTELASARRQGMQTLTGLLAAIAIVSLVVGGIGIMNIMLVSVTERTREIGIRMAVGAKPSHIMTQFLVEAMTLSMTGGFLGIGLGFAASKLLANSLNWTFVVRSDIVAVSFLFSAAVGVIFGLYPARKASNLNPIEALRYE